MSSGSPALAVPHTASESMASHVSPVHFRKNTVGPSCTSAAAQYSTPASSQVYFTTVEPSGRAAAIAVLSQAGPEPLAVADSDTADSVGADALSVAAGLVAAGLVAAALVEASDDVEPEEHPAKLDRANPATARPIAGRARVYMPVSV